MQTATLPDEHGNIGASLDYVLGQALPKTARILGVGCHFGSLLENLRRRGYRNVMGIDVVKEFITTGKAAYPKLAPALKAYNGHRIPLAKDSVDAVLMFDVIKHIPDVDRFLEEEVYRVLKPGGRFIFQTPNKLINIPWEIINTRSLTAWRSYHMSLQTYPSLRRLLQQAGFSSVVIERTTVLTPYKLEKVRRKAGVPGLVVLHILERLPMHLTPNLWGHAVKQ